MEPIVKKMMLLAFNYRKGLGGKMLAVKKQKNAAMYVN
jgi:hypothetical protein